MLSGLAFVAYTYTMTYWLKSAAIHLWTSADLDPSGSAMVYSRVRTEISSNSVHVQFMLHTHTHLTALFPGLPGWAGTRKIKPIWTLLKQETVSSSGISWTICKSAPRSRQVTTPASHHSVFYRPDAFPAAQPTASKHWRQVQFMLN